MMFAQAEGGATEAMEEDDGETVNSPVWRSHWAGRQCSCDFCRHAEVSDYLLDL